MYWPIFAAPSASPGRRRHAGKSSRSASSARPRASSRPADSSRQGRKALFKAQAERVQATVSEVAQAADVPAEVARYLRERNLPATIRRGADERLAAMPWAATTLAVSEGRSNGADLSSVSHAFGGVAETGTLIMTSGKDNPTTLNFLADNHIVVLQAQDISGDYERVWQKLRTRYGKGLMPRTVNMITGPSRSADIAHTLLLGAHGPRNLHIIVVDEA
jgi:L-lactate dehydrogenase complex protein LldG